MIQIFMSRVVTRGGQQRADREGEGAVGRGRMNVPPIGVAAGGATPEPLIVAFGGRMI